MNYDIKNDSLELIRKFLPKYLTPEQKENLFKVVNENFPRSDESSLIYFNIPERNTFYQGDGIIDIPFAMFDSGEYKTTYFRGVIMSNTCDISTKNKRLEDSYVQLSCIFELNKYILELKNRKISQERINSFLSNLKKNRISNLFYLPEKKSGKTTLLPESFIRFDINTTFPIKILDKNYDKKYSIENGDRLFSFSNYGFYVFLIKLSIHYCRFREGVFRSA